MKKIKFAAQIFILAAAFPVIFISGISHNSKKTKQPVMQPYDSITVKKKIPASDCFCKAPAPGYIETIHQALTAN